MSKDYLKPDHTLIFCRTGVFVSTVLRGDCLLRIPFLLVLTVFLALGTIGQVAAEDIVYPDASTQKILIPKTIRITDTFVDAVAPETEEMATNQFKSKSLSGNTITIHSGGNPAQFVLGAINTFGADEIRNNIITIHSGAVISDTTGNPSNFAGVYAGYSLKGNVTGNQIFVTNGTIKNTAGTYGSVVGAYGLNAIGNSVTMDGSEVCLEVRGGHATTSADSNTRSYNSTASENRVSIRNSQVGAYVYGGYTQIQDADCSGIATASLNEVYISGVTVGTAVYGGDVFGGKVVNNGTGSSEAIGNIVIIDNKSHVQGDVKGGGVECFGANIHLISDNCVVVRGGSTVSHYVYGGWFSGSLASGTATGNKVSLSDSVVEYGVAGAHADGALTAEALKNSVTVSNSTVMRDINGGYAKADTTTASDNKVTVSNSTVGLDIHGGYAYSKASGAAAIASGNQVIINDNSDIHGKVFGGFANSDTSATASHNTVTINGGDFQENTYGGYAVGGSSSTATYNTVNLMAGTLHSILYGGNGTGSNADYFTGNTLNVIGYQGSVGRITNFEYFNFMMPSVLTPELTMVHITGSETHSSTHLDNTRVTLNGKLPGGNIGLNPGDRIILIDLTDGTPDSMTALPIRQGVALIYDFRLSAADNQLAAILQRQRPGKEIVDGRLPLLAFLNRGADLEELRTARCTRGPFVNVGGNWNRYNTGGYIDVDGLTVRTGLTRCFNFARGKLLLAPFFEMGKGESDTFNIYDGNAIRAHGKLGYFGGGLMSKYYLDNGRYYDASFRAGGAEIDYYSADLSHLTGVRAAFDISSLYLGTHFGMGYEWNVSRNMSFDVYGKYLYQHLASGTVTIADDPIHFCGLNSHRTRIGGRVNHVVTRRLGFYHGAAWEHEFNATEYANIYEYQLAGRSLQGDSGVGELGLTLKRTPTMPLNIDFGIQGYVGKREGGAANLQVRWER